MHLDGLQWRELPKGAVLNWSAWQLNELYKGASTCVVLI
jgi:hypothetical protein